jgi:hypothetical protein
LASPSNRSRSFINSEASLIGKQVELLKEIAPRLTRVAIMFNPDTAPGGGAYYLGPFEAAAKSLDALERGGLLRSSDEAGVMPVERRERVIAIDSGQPATGGARCSMEGGSLRAMARAV